MSGADLLGVYEISPDMRVEMRGRSHHDDNACPNFAALRLVRLRHIGFDGAQHSGELVVHAEVADEVLHIFEQLYTAGFPIASVRRVDHFAGSDEASMAANNSSAFNFRRVQGTALLSHHALGMAIDINPVQNPWLRGERVDPPEGRAYLERAQIRPGMIVRPGPVVAAFDAVGWYWGGDFASEPDYHHFSKLPR